MARLPTHRLVVDLEFHADGVEAGGWAGIFHRGSPLRPLRAVISRLPLDCTASSAPHSASRHYKNSSLSWIEPEYPFFALALTLTLVRARVPHDQAGEKEKLSCILGVSL